MKKVSKRKKNAIIRITVFMIYLVAQIICTAIDFHNYGTITGRALVPFLFYEMLLFWAYFL